MGHLRKLLCLLCVLSLVLLSGTPITLSVSAAEAAGSGALERVYDLGNTETGAEESGILVVVNPDDALGAAPVAGEPVNSLIPDATGQDTVSNGPLNIDSGEIMASGDSEWGGGYDLGAGVVTPDAQPSVTVSESSVSLKKGETVSVTVTVSGYPAGSYLQSSNSNFNAFSSAWGSWKGTSIPIRVTGKANGSGSIIINLKDTGGSVLASATVQVTVMDAVPSLTVSPGSITVDVGSTGTATLRVLNYSGGGYVSAKSSDPSVCDSQWGSWSGWSIPVKVTGKAAGSAKITLQLFNTLNTFLASVTLNVSVSAKASIASISPDSPSVEAGSSVGITVKVNGTTSSGDYLQYSLSNSTAFSAAWDGSWSGGTARLNLTGKNAGNGTLTVTLRNRAGTALDSKSVPVTVFVRNNPRVTVAPSSVKVEAGADVKVNCTGMNISESFSLRYVNNTPSLISCAWKDSWSGNTVPLTVTGKSTGTASVTVELLVGDAVRGSAEISVEVSSSGGGGENGGGGGKLVPYNFQNYSKPRISLAICQKMFGNTQRAQTVYMWDIGNGGVCFGMSASSGLLNSPNSPAPTTFENGDIFKLKKTDYSSELGMSLSDFIEAIHITQVSSTMREYSGLSNLVSAVRSGGTDQPVIICVRGPGGGHAILGYGVTDSGSVRVYDSNWPGQERIVNINGNNWSYELWSGLTWNSSNGKITYIPYSVYSSVWSSRGRLNGVRLMDSFLYEEDSDYLLTTSADDFTLIDFFGNVMARYEGGLLTFQDDSVREVFLDSALMGDEDPIPVHMLYVPEDFYTVRNETGGMMDVSLSGLDLSIRVNTETEEFDLAVSDRESFANAILSPEDGQEYAISVGSSREGDPDETIIEGTGNGQTISLGIAQDGLYISNGTDDGMLSLGELEEGESSNEIIQDFTLSSSNYDPKYPITASAGNGGTIYPDGVTTVQENGSQSYRIQPADGYSLRAIYVNGVEAVYGGSEDGAPAYIYFNGAYEYTFRDLNDTATIYAEFAKEISNCDIRAVNENGLPVVTITDPSREEGARLLSENEDFLWSLRKDEENGETYLVIQAVAGGMYSGVYQTPYTYHDNSGESAPEIHSGVYDPTNHRIRAVVSGSEAFSLMGAVYSLQPDGTQGKMLAYLPTQVWQRSEKSGDGIPVLASLDEAALPERFTVKLFLMDGSNFLLPLAAPTVVSVDNGK